MEFLGLYNNIFFFLILLISIPSCFSTFISDGICDCHGSTGRFQLQTKQSCPVNFEFQDYKIITDQCKGPNYLPELCCKAFKVFACPFAAELNDLTNDCATTMFSYINLYGKYPPGLFASECREGELGLECTNVTTSALSEKTSASPFVLHPSSLLRLSDGFRPTESLKILIFRVLKRIFSFVFASFSLFQF